MRSHLRLQLPSFSDLNLDFSSSSSSSSSALFALSIPALSRCSSTSSSSSSSSSAPLTCPPTPIVSQILSSWHKYEWNNSSDALTSWLNARWKKSGYAIDARTVNFLIKLHGCTEAQMGLGDGLDAFMPYNVGFLLFVALNWIHDP
ncbi:hypothetical protein M436DRAFT_77996 [Aureobasidium namibiae CBS 147.97]|uniref:Uncharacterized protein n=1 Tax=Aureobasidium namibiae CBS 147.97 TaxID=1043004 RepID=A0A074X813_9PEZI